MRTLKLLLRIAASLVIFVAVLEFCARLDDFFTYGAPILSSYSSEGLLRHDQIGKVGKPGARYKKWKLNSLGYRGPELRPGTVRIVCFGASETFGLYEEPDQEYPRQLERDLNQWAGKPTFEVVNVAYPAQTVAAAVLRAPEVIEQVKPTFAVIYPFPGSYVWLPWIQPPSGNGDQESSRPRFEWRLGERIRNAAKSLLGEFIQSKIRDLETRRIEEKVRKNTAGYPVMDHIPEKNVKLFHSDLVRLVDVLRQNGVEPILVTHATVFSNPLSPSDQQMLAVWRGWIPMLTGEGLLEMEHRMNGEIRSVADERHTVLVDAAVEIPTSNKYFADFTHFTTQGAELMAEKLAEGMEPVLSPQVANSAKQFPSPPKTNDLAPSSDYH